MKYQSTRGHAELRSFCEILLEGLAPDGGLYLPTHYPRIDAATLARWRGLAYHELAFEILSLYIDDIPADDLRAITARTYTPEVFGTPEITPLKPLEAMAQGKIVAASAVGGHRELMTDGITGTLFAPDDPAACATALAHLLADPASWNALHANGRAHVRADHDWARNVSRYLRVYQTLIDHKQESDIGAAA